MNRKETNRPEEANRFRPAITGRFLLSFAAALGLLPAMCGRAQSQFTTNNFFNWETPPVHPVVLSPDGSTLAVCNLPDDHLEFFDVSSGTLVSLASVPVGLNPVSACFRTTNELWVAN